MVKKQASECKLWERLKELGEDMLTLDIDAKHTKEGDRIKKELNRRTKLDLKRQGLALKRYYEKHPCIDED